MQVVHPILQRNVNIGAEAAELSRAFLITMLGIANSGQSL